MIVEDQAEAVAFLASSSTHRGAAVERIDTHGAMIVLAGDRAYKLKRAVRFDYMDFSTLEKRHSFCEAEVRLNRRTAPEIYQGVVPVVRQADGALALGGAGDPIEWLVAMRRFDQDQLLDRLAAAGRLDVELMVALAATIARFHAAAEPRLDHGGRAGMAWVVDGNAAGFAEFGAGGLDPATSARVTRDAHRELQRLGSLLDERRRAGWVRQCHGDLHLRNIVLLDGQPTLFDGVEFNDEIACIDVWYDLAFLIMDLWRRQLARHANAVFNRYVADTGDLQALPLLPLFLSCRAAVRAKTSATAALVQGDEARRGELQALAAEYLTMAGSLLHPPEPCLVAIGGLSGSGKSTAAMAMAPSVGAVPGAIVLRSDEIRKRLCAVPSSQRLGPEGYTPEVSARVYETLFDRARLALLAGHSVILDAVFSEPARRDAAGRLALEVSVPFVGCWLTAPEATLIARVERRRNDPSDADAAVVRQQQAQDIGSMTWHRLDASLSGDVLVNRALSLVRRELTIR